MPVDAVEMVSVEDAEPFEVNATLVEPRETPGPLGETVAVSETAPVKLLRLVKLKVTDPDDPWAMVSMVGLDVALKSGPAFVLEWTSMLPTICCRCIEQ
jgi:hypothetical protein